MSRPLPVGRERPRMAIAHKDAGLYDSEAQTSRSRPASRILRRRRRIESVRLLVAYERREFLDIPAAVPDHAGIVLGTNLPADCRQRVQQLLHCARLGHTYYGQTSPAAPPKYGTQGTFTQQRYASSRYVQSGGFTVRATPRTRRIVQRGHRLRRDRSRISGKPRVITGRASALGTARAARLPVVASARHRARVLRGKALGTDAEAL